MIFRFDTFELDTSNRRLTRGEERVPLTNTLFEILHCLVVHAPDPVLREALAKAGWGGVASAASIEKAISQLRKKLGSNGKVYIETIANRGYRFVEPVERLEPWESVATRTEEDDPRRDYLLGRRELATLRVDRVENASRAFERTILRVPDHAGAHAGLAMAGALLFEESWADERCDVARLARAVEHGYRATMLNPTLADAHSALGFALCLSGESDSAIISASKAVELEEARWPHWLRLAYVTSGDERIEAASRALKLLPELAYAHWLIGTALIARGAFDEALIHLRRGCALQWRQSGVSGPYPPVGLPLLHGLLLLALNRVDEAVQQFREELSGPDRRQIYSRRCYANTCYALGAVDLQQGDKNGAIANFRRALEIAPGHFFSMAALGLPLPAIAPNDPRIVDATIAQAIALTRRGQPGEAMETYCSAVMGARIANAGWILPVEPILRPLERPDIWGDALALVISRAT